MEGGGAYPSHVNAEGAEIIEKYFCFFAPKVRKNENQSAK